MGSVLIAASECKHIFPPCAKGALHLTAYLSSLSIPPNPPPAPCPYEGVCMGSVLIAASECKHIFLLCAKGLTPPHPPTLRPPWAQMGAKAMLCIVITTSKRVAPMLHFWTVCILAWARAVYAVGAQNTAVFWTPHWKVFAVGARNTHSLLSKFWTPVYRVYAVGARNRQILYTTLATPFRRVMREAGRGGEGGGRGGVGGEGGGNSWGR